MKIIPMPISTSCSTTSRVKRFSRGPLHVACCPASASMPRVARFGPATFAAVAGAALGVAAGVVPSSLLGAAQADSVRPARTAAQIVLAVLAGFLPRIISDSSIAVNRFGPTVSKATSRERHLHGWCRPRSSGWGDQVRPSGQRVLMVACGLQQKGLMDEAKAIFRRVPAGPQKQSRV